MLEIRLFGEFRLARDGKIARLSQSKKTRALLAYLIATGRDHSRRQLCELFWEGPHDPRAQLRWSLTKLRAALDSGKLKRLLTEGNCVSFRAAGAAIDFPIVRALGRGGLSQVPTAALCQAADCLQRDFLENLELPACYRYQEWLIGEREGLRVVRRRVLEALVARLGEEKDQALHYARERVIVDPLDEEGHIAVMRLLVGLGRRRDALTQYESCRRILAAELGRAPSLDMERARSSSL